MNTYSNEDELIVSTEAMDDDLPDEDDVDPDEDEDPEEDDPEEDIDSDDDLDEGDPTPDDNYGEDDNPNPEEDEKEQEISEYLLNIDKLTLDELMFRNVVKKHISAILADPPEDMTQETLSSLYNLKVYWINLLSKNSIENILKSYNLKINE